MTSETKTEALGRFGWNTDPVMDFLVEAEVLQDDVHNAINGITDIDPARILDKINLTLSLRFLDDSARDAQRMLAEEGKKLLDYIVLSDAQKGAMHLRHSAGLLRQHSNGNPNAIWQAMVLEHRAEELEALEKFVSTPAALSQSGDAK